MRLVSRTHYQVDEPSLVAAVVRLYTSPVQSDFRDNVSRKLSESSSTINSAAAGYAVDLARALGLLHDNLVWTDLGHLLSVVYAPKETIDNKTLSAVERYFFLRIFVEFDGAALIFFAKRIEEFGQVPRSNEGWDEVAQSLFRDVYSDYLRLATDPQDRVRIRGLVERRAARPFRGKSGPHQCYLHAQTLTRLGLITKAAGRERVYLRKSSTPGTPSPTARLLSMFRDAEDLEKVVAAGHIYHVVEKLIGRPRKVGQLTEQQFSQFARQVYDQVISSGVTLCPVQTLTEAIQIESLRLGTKPFAPGEIIAQLRSMQRDAPRAIRFHVDVYGRPAFIKIS